MHLPIYVNALIYDFLYFTNIKLHETATTLEYGVLGKLNLCSQAIVIYIFAHILGFLVVVSSPYLPRISELGSKH